LLSIKASRGKSRIFYILLCLLSTSTFAKVQKIDLNEVLREAVNGHPKVLEIQNIAKASRDVPSRVGSLPDPMLQFTAQNFRTDDFTSDSSPMSALGVGLVQDLPFPGKLARKSKVAESNAKTVTEKTRLVKALVIFNLVKAYWNLHFAERAHVITQENIKIIDILADVAINRVKVAKVAQQDAFQAQVAHSKLRAMLIHRREVLINAKRNLNEAIGRDPESKIGITQSPPITDIIEVSSILSEEVRKSSPYLKVANLKVEQGKSTLSEAKYDRLPNFKLGVNYKIRDPVPGDKTDGADMVSIMVGISLPIWMGSKQNARVSENIHKLNAFKQQQRNVDLHIGTQLKILSEKISSSNIEIKLYQKEVLPRANKALSASITDYKRAKVGFVSVVKNWNTELDLQINYEKLLKDRAILISEVELITGISLRRLGL
jgi:outer membrane protein TolC